jgi:hypothetical protein
MSTIYLVIVLFVIPAAPGSPETAVELRREVISASSPAACKAHADKLAAQQREANAAAVQRFKARVEGTCTQLKEAQT